ncbi:Uncharacterised protein (plasmid) [Tsukamurella tyrosinosolvens]|uniref:Uncharacterized protein n=1 Tax=Tsukamurella tyrosinosolvens TaxID=57704 RepID=A0A1H4UDV7_TSUTY|nr:hypothetical protein [Tsukamurella tyrosinosolvens]KXO92961.1 hypothetical protein AXK58_13910 [Tsukamurella tyrosinosolvens]SEC66461.1 hypothetical protein SAMN04489793_2855 [Tsukamurella tyrosinosolvens]VEH94133.1 Uncharacterised protein [Tsukamurella tyrosinosolvens]
MTEPHNIFMLGVFAFAIGMAAAAVEPSAPGAPAVIRVWSSLIARVLTAAGGGAMATSLIAAA